MEVTLRLGWPVWNIVHVLYHCVYTGCKRAGDPVWTGAEASYYPGLLHGLQCGTEALVDLFTPHQVFHSAYVTLPLQVQKNKDPFFDAWNSCLHHIASLALAHIHTGNNCYCY